MHKKEFLYSKMSGEPYSVDAASVTKRALKNGALNYLLRLKDDTINKDCLTRFREATNMTDSVAAIRALPKCTERETAFKEFYEKWKGESLVCQKWLAMQVIIPGKMSGHHHSSALTKHSLVVGVPTVIRDSYLFSYLALHSYTTCTVEECYDT